NMTSIIGAPHVGHIFGSFSIIIRALDKLKVIKFDKFYELNKFCIGNLLFIILNIIFYMIVVYNTT
ncbi:MAG: hypothetical protein ACTSRP_28215, partial [Candidatus Helarchaeota archaeon]